MAHSYAFKTPDVSLDREVIQFFEDFYRISDTPETMAITSTNSRITQHS